MAANIEHTSEISTASGNLHSLLPILVCPQCKSSLEYLPLDESDGVLKCGVCSSWYPVREDIPVLLQDDLRDPDLEQEFLARYAQDIPFITSTERIAAGQGPAAQPLLVQKRYQSKTWSRQYSAPDDTIALGSITLPLVPPLYQLWTITSYLKLTMQSGDTLLELGCGKEGLVKWAIARGVGMYVGIDISEVGVRKVLEKYRGIEQPRFLCVVADAETLPFQRNTFDCCVAQWLLEHLPHPMVCASEVLRILKPGGRWYIDTNSRHFFLTYRWFQKILAPRRYQNRMQEAGHDENKFFLQRELQASLEKVGFVHLKSSLAYFLLDMFIELRLRNLALSAVKKFRRRPMAGSGLPSASSPDADKARAHLQHAVIKRSRLRGAVNFFSVVVKVIIYPFDRVLQLLGQGESVLVVARKPPI